MMEFFNARTVHFDLQRGLWVQACRPYDVCAATIRKASTSIRFLYENWKAKHCMFCFFLNGSLKQNRSNLIDTQLNNRHNWLAICQEL